MKDIDDDTLDSFLKRLHLANARRLWSPLAQQAETEQWSYRDFLAVLVAEEIAHRKQTRLLKMTRAAGFPFLKTIDDFDFTFQSTLRQSMLGSYLSPDFVTEGRCLTLAGKPGRGKTHLAFAVAYRAIWRPRVRQRAARRRTRKARHPTDRSEKGQVQALD
jgi:DNA replication protein DnaC